jgi:hypothetical protein
MTEQNQTPADIDDTTGHGRVRDDDDTDDTTGHARARDDDDTDDTEGHQSLLNRGIG